MLYQLARLLIMLDGTRWRNTRMEGVSLYLDVGYCKTTDTGGAHPHKTTSEPNNASHPPPSALSVKPIDREQLKLTPVAKTLCIECVVRGLTNHQYFFSHHGYLQAARPHPPRSSRTKSQTISSMISRSPCRESSRRQELHGLAFA